MDIPEVVLELNEDQLHAICSRIDPLQNSETFGVKKMYMQLRSDILEVVS
jgi:hypothetical protein